MEIPNHETNLSPSLNSHPNVMTFLVQHPSKSFESNVVYVPVLPLISKRKTASVLEAAKEGPNASKGELRKELVKWPSILHQSLSLILYLHTTYLRRFIASSLITRVIVALLFSCLLLAIQLGQSDNQPNASKRSLRHLLLVYAMT